MDLESRTPDKHMLPKFFSHDIRGFGLRGYVELGCGAGLLAMLRVFLSQILYLIWSVVSQLAGVYGYVPERWYK